MEDDVVENRIPSTDKVLGIPPGLAEDFERARAKEASICEDYRSGLTRIRDAYVSHLTTAVEKETNEKTKGNLLTQAERAKDLDAWIELLAPESGVGSPE